MLSGYVPGPMSPGSIPVGGMPYEMCSCIIIRPGRIVCPARSIACAPSGESTSSYGPSAAIRPSATNEGQAFCSLRPRSVDDASVAQHERRRVAREIGPYRVAGKGCSWTSAGARFIGAVPTSLRAKKAR
jgi:hypothetical protein